MTVAGASAPEVSRMPPLRAPVVVLLVALAYFVSGRLGLLLAIPPGYATAVWPASGIALAAVILRSYWALPGIFLGSFAVNVSNAFDASSLDATLSSLPVPGLIALGATVQAAVAGWLVRRFVGYHNLLEQELDIVRLLALGGPLASLTNSSIGVGTLYLYGLIPSESVLFSWWTWWVGDTIGVLIFTPLVLVWSLRPAAQWLRRQLQVTVPLAILFASVVWLFIYMSGREQARVQAQFDDWCSDVGRQIETTLDQRLQALYALQAFYASSEKVTLTEFQDFAARLLERSKGLLGFSWNPMLPAGSRAAFEQRMRSELGASYTLFENDTGRQRRPLSARSLYVPVAYVVPLLGNDLALGFDVASEAQRANALWRARDSGRAAATRPVQLVQDQTQQPGLLIFAPIYHAGVPADTTERRRQNLEGFVAAVIKLSDLIPLTLAGGDSSAMEVLIQDVSDAEATLLYRSTPAAARAGLIHAQEFEVGGRRWRIDFSLPDQYLIAHRSWQVWVLLAAGMLFTGLLGMFLPVIIGRSSRIAHLVEERTAQLQEVNRSLIREAARSERLETEARARADQLAATNRELEQFAFVVSHDLQAPLRNIQSFAKLLEKRHGAGLADEAKEFLQFLRGSATDMGRLIDDLLQLSRVNPKRANMERTRAGDALNAALANLRTDIEVRGALVEHAELPEVFGDAGLLTQLFQNLIGNAIKFQRPGVPPQVRIGVELVRGEWLFSVADNGIGIAEKNIGRLFQIFRRLHTAEEYPGSGIGLVLCKKIVALHGGRIWLESKIGEGTTFFFALPLQAPPAMAGSDFTIIS